MKAISVLFSLFSLFLFEAAGWRADAKTVKIAVLPCSNVVTTYERFKPLTDYLQSETGLAIETVVAENEAHLVQLLRKGTIDFIFHSTSGFAKIADLLDPQSVLKALGQDGKDYEIGYLIVRKDSGINTFQDLKGKRVILGMECSANRLAFAQNIFREHGIDIEKDLESYQEGGCCENICYNVFLKAVDAGLVCKHFYEAEKKLGKKYIEALAVLGQGSRMPTRIFAAYMETPQAIIDQFLHVLTAIDRNDPKYERLVNTSELGGFVLATPDEFQKLTGS